MNSAILCDSSRLHVTDLFMWIESLLLKTKTLQNTTTIVTCIQCIVIIHNLYINWHNLSISPSGYDRKCLVLTIKKIYNPPYFTHIYCCTQVLFSRTSYISNCNIWYLQWLAAVRSLYLTTDYHNDHLPSHYVPSFITVLWLVPNYAAWWQTNNDLNNFSANLTSDKEIMSSSDIRKAWTYVSSLACIGLD